MSPRGFMRVQAVLAVLAFLPLAFSPPRLGLWALAGGIATAATVLFSLYRVKLGSRERSPDRVKDDHEVARQVTLILSAVALATGISFWLDKPDLWHEPRLSVGAVALAAFWTAIYVSSLFDWYYVRARRDGVVVPPPCKSSDVNWTYVTRAWWTNRYLVVLACYLAGISAVVAFSLAALGDTGDSNAAVGSVVVAAVVAATTMIRLFYGNLASVGTVATSCVLSPPDIVLGDRAVGSEAFVGGYVWNIALEAIEFVLLDSQGQPRVKRGKPATKRHSLEEVLKAGELETLPYEGCASTCLHVNVDCQWMEPKADSLKGPAH
jgi:hypothetical protein